MRAGGILAIVQAPAAFRSFREPCSQAVYNCSQLLTSICHQNARGAPSCPGGRLPNMDDFTSNSLTSNNCTRNVFPAQAPRPENVVKCGHFQSVTQPNPKMLSNVVICTAPEVRKPRPSSLFRIAVVSRCARHLHQTARKVLATLSKHALSPLPSFRLPQAARPDLQVRRRTGVCP